MSAKASKAPTKKGSGKAKRRHDPPKGHEGGQPSKNRKQRSWYEALPQGYWIKKGKIVKKD